MMKKSPHAPVSQQKNVINSIMSFLPDNRPITSLQIVQDFEKCPKNFTTVHRTYDQDQDADLWRETNIIFGRPTSRYLCISKTEGLPEYVLETLKIISEKDSAPQEFSLLSRTADTEQKAWRKKQIAYKLSKRSYVTNAITDIILCSKLKTSPHGFKFAGEINGILVCYKTGTISSIVSPLPILPSIGPLNNQYNNNYVNTKIPEASEIETALNKINFKPNKKVTTDPNEHDYEEIRSSYQLSPKRPAPKPPAVLSSVAGTLGAYSDVEGIPFVLNKKLAKGSDWCDNLMKEITNKTSLFELPNTNSSANDYDFQLERQILCTMKSSSSTNPFFK